MSEPHLPTFFIVGAPKGGTTAMYSYLRAHPDLFLPERKELRYFGADLEIRDRHKLSSEEYLAYFADAPDGATIGTAYVWYLFSRLAASEIRAFSPNARIIAMLRDPVEMIPALHSEHLSNGNEDLSDLGLALDAEKDRAQGRRIPPHAHLPQGLLYSRVPRYSEQLERYFDSFGRDRVLVVLYDDFRTDPGAVYAAALRFLGVDDEFRPPSFERINTNRKIRSERVRHFLSRPPDRARRVIRAVVPAGLRRGLYDRAHRLNIRHVEREPMPAAVRARLSAMFADEIANLSALLGRDLSSWASPAAADREPAGFLSSR